MIKLEKPLEFEAKLVGEDKDNLFFEIPEHIQKLIPKEAKYVYCKILDKISSPN